MDVLNYADRLEYAKVFKDDNNAKVMVELINQKEWPKSTKPLEEVKAVLASLSDNKEFLAGWIESIYEEADAAQTKKLQELGSW